MKNGMGIFGQAALMAALACAPAFAVRPEADAKVDASVDGVSAVAALESHSGSPYRAGFKKAKRLVKEHLLAAGETLRSGKVDLRGSDASVQVTGRLNRLLRQVGGEVRINRIQTDSRGNKHIRLQQYHHGVPVIGSDMVVHVNMAGEVYGTGGFLTEGLAAKTVATLRGDQARSRTRSALRASNAAIERQAPRLVVFDDVLAYESILEEPGNPPAVWKVYVHADDGTLLHRENRIIHGAPVGGAAHPVTGAVLTGEGGGTVTLNGWRDDGSIYFLHNRIARWGVYDQDRFDWSQNLTGNWGVTDRAAVSLARNMESTLRYAADVLSLDSYDDAGTLASAYVHEGTNYVNAYWDGSGFHFGDGDGITANPLTVLDVAAHEFGHAITQYSSGLVYSYESGALNESFSDILGALVEFWAQPDGRSAYPAGQDGLADYLMGEDCWLSGEALRDLRNPGRFGQPSSYRGTNWYTGSGDNGGVHYNSGVQNFAFYLLAEGGVGSNDGRPYNISGLGIEAAGAIAMYANMFLLTSGAQYQDAREAWVLAATTLGHNAQTVRDVWTACGVLDQVNNLAVSLDTLNFGNVGAGSSEIRNLTFSNNGALTTTVTGLTFGNPAFSTTATVPFSVAGGSSITVGVRFLPPTSGTQNGVLTIASNADDNPSLTVVLTGAGTEPAGMVVTPASLDAAIPVGDTTALTLTITNNGVADLVFAPSTQEIARPASPSAGGKRVLFLYAGTSPAAFRTTLDSLPNVDTLSVFDASTRSPTAALLAAHDVVVVASSNSWFSPPGIGDLLADYVDAGGGVVLMGATFHQGGNWVLQGRIMTPAYAPLAAVSYSFNSVTSITLANHPINQGVSVVTSSLWANSTSLQGAGMSLGTFSGGYHVGAYNPQKPIVSLNAYPVAPYYGGDMVRQVQNAIDFTAKGSWLRVAEEGTPIRVLQGASSTLEVVLDARDISGGSYTGAVNLTHNVPGLSNPLVVPVTLAVDGYRRLSASTQTLAFGNLRAGDRDTLTLTLSNSGDEATTLTDFAFDHSEFNLSGTPPTVLPGHASLTLQVVFSPADLGSENGTLRILSDAEDNPEIRISLTGAATPAPALELAPAAFSLTLPTGETGTRNLVISNPGGDDLHWSLSGVSATWLSASVRADTLAPGDSQSITLTANASGLLGGVYSGNLNLVHNAPASPNPLVIPFTLTVDGVRRLVVNPTTLSYGTVWQGTTTRRTVTVANPGSESTTLTALDFDNPVFRCTTALPRVIRPFDSAVLTVEFIPSDTTQETGLLTLVSDAEDMPILGVTLSGTAIPPPVASLTPEHFDIHLDPFDAPADRTAILSNTGGDRLRYQITRISQTGSPGSYGVRAPILSAIPAVPDLARIHAALHSSAEYVPGEIIVALKPNHQDFAVSSLPTSLGVQGMRELAVARNPKTGLRSHGGRKLLLLKLNPQGLAPLSDVIDRIRQDAHVEYAEPNYIRRLVGVPNDPSFGSLYGMHNTGQSGGRVDADIDAPEAWDRHTGNRNLVLGVIDTGIDWLHPDLAANMWTNAVELAGTTGVDDDGNGYVDDIRGYDFINRDALPMDDHGHGTHCAGTIGAVGNNAVGVAGVSWITNMAALKIFNASGSTNDAAILDAVDYSNAMGMKITSNSWGGGPYSQSLFDLIAEGRSLGHLFIAAAGNNGSNTDVSPNYPSGYALDNIISVAATDRMDNRASYSNYGATSVDLGAPGSDILSCAPGGGYQNMSGTSMATPHVAGAAFLVWSANPFLTASQLRDLLFASVDPLASMAGITVTGGRLNVARALEEAGPAWLTAGPMVPGEVAPGDSVPLRVTVNPVGLIAGTWTGTVTVATDDPIRPELTVTVAAHISGCRSLAVEPDSLDFGSRFTGTVTPLILRLRNDCNDTTTVASLAFSHPFFRSRGPAIIRIPPFSLVEHTVEFAPTSAAALAGTLTLTSDADTDSVQQVALTGISVDPPVATIDPSSVVRNLTSGSTTTVDLRIGNTGGSSLQWRLDNVLRGLAALPAYDSTHYQSQAKGEADTRVGEPVLGAVGGPDAFGYRWMDSNEPNGPTYVWNDIRTTGQSVVGGCDDCYAQMPLSFAFPIYGSNFTTLNITSNGWVNFGSPSSQYSNYPVPSTSMPRYLVAGFFDDLETYSGSVYFQDFGDRAVIQYQDVRRLAGDGTLTFQIVLQRNGTIHLYYANVTGNLLSGTTGIQNGTGTVGLAMQYNTTYIRNGLAVRIGTVPDWLRVSALSGTVEPGETQVVGLTLDANGLVPGTYAQTITLVHNNPLVAPIPVPVTLTVDAVGMSRVLRIGPSALAAATGSRYSLWNITAGGEARGLARGSRYVLYLK